MAGEEKARIPGQPSAKAQQMLGLVQRALRVEAQQLDGGTGSMLSRLMAVDVTRWQDEETLIALMKGIWRKSLMDSGIDEVGAELFIGSSDETSVLWEVERVLADAEQALQERQLAEAEQAAASEAAAIEPAPEATSSEAVAIEQAPEAAASEAAAIEPASAAAAPQLAGFASDKEAEA